jgi:hypothetical protein
MINERIFYEEKEEESSNLNFLHINNPFKSTPETLTFVDEAMKYHKKAIEEYLGILREVNYEVSDRKERIDSLEG